MNSILQLKEPKNITNVELLPTEQFPRIETAKRSILDVKCTDQRNHQYIVEMQNEKLANFTKRSQFYVANAYVSQLGKGVDYIKLNPVVLLAIIDDTLFPKKKGYISHHHTLDIKTHEKDLEDLSYAFVELPKFKKKEEELKTAEDQWLYLFRNAQKMNDIPKNIPEEIKEAYKALEEFNWTSEEREAYFKANLAIADEIDASRTAKEEERRDIAIALLEMKEPDEKILKATKLTLQKLEQIKNEIKKNEQGEQNNNFK